MASVERRTEGRRAHTRGADRKATPKPGTKKPRRKKDAGRQETEGTVDESAIHDEGEPEWWLSGTD